MAFFELFSINENLQIDIIHFLIIVGLSPWKGHSALLRQAELNALVDLHVNEAMTHTSLEQNHSQKRLRKVWLLGSATGIESTALRLIRTRGFLIKKPSCRNCRNSPLNFTFISSVTWHVCN